MEQAASGVLTMRVQATVGLAQPMPFSSFLCGMKQLSILMLAMVLLSACSKKLIPSCVQQKIDEIKAQPKWNPPAEVNEYEYKGQRVFLFTADCCDQFISLIDQNCNYVCAPSGGITGSGDGKCKDFFQVAKHIRLVWKDAR